MANDGCMRLREYEESENEILRCGSSERKWPISMCVSQIVGKKRNRNTCGMVSFVAEICDARCIFACNKIDPNDFQINMSI